MEKEDLVGFFKGEVIKHSHSEIKVTDKEILFRNDLSTWALTRFTNRWGNFSTGRFHVIENSETMIVRFTGELKRAFILSSFPSMFLALPVLIFLRPFNIGLVIMVLLIWPVLFFTKTGIEKMTFPIYLNNQKTKILEGIRDHQNWTGN